MNRNSQITYPIIKIHQIIAKTTVEKAVKNLKNKFKNFKIDVNYMKF